MAATLSVTLLAALAPPLDDLWLRAHYDSSIAARYVKSISAVSVHGTSPLTSVDVEQLTTVANELELSLSHMLGRHTPVHCCSASSLSPTTLSVEVSHDYFDSLGDEGFAITGTSIQAATPSGALYATYRLLSLVQRGVWQPAGAAVRSKPAMALRIWDLWDQLSGDVTRGFSGYSNIWPQAKWEPWGGPPPTRLYLAPCNSSDPYQRWGGPWEHNVSAPLKNRASGGHSARHERHVCETRSAR